MEQTAEQVPPVHTSPIPADDGRTGWWSRRFQPERPMVEYTLECRLYRHEHRLAGYQQERWVHDALVAAASRT